MHVVELDQKSNISVRPNQNWHNDQFHNGTIPKFGNYNDSTIIVDINRDNGKMYFEQKCEWRPFGKAKNTNKQSVIKG